MNTLSEQSAMPLESSYRTITLTQGQVAIVDVEDYDWLMQWKWYAHLDKHSGRFYAVRNKTKAEGKSGMVRMHNVICGTPNGSHTDHGDGNKLNNRRYNLRSCTVSQNGANRGPTARNKLRLKGVRWKSDKKKYQARITHSRTDEHLGYFINPQDAARAYDRKALELFGKFAWLNFPNERNQRLAEIEAAKKGAA